MSRQLEWRLEKRPQNIIVRIDPSKAFLPSQRSRKLGAAARDFWGRNAVFNRALLPSDRVIAVRESEDDIDGLATEMRVAEMVATMTARKTRFACWPPDEYNRVRDVMMMQVAKPKRMLADWDNKERLACYIKEGQPDPSTIVIGSGKKFKFKCSQCMHVFEPTISSVTKVKRPQWCPYCGGKRLCGATECRLCMARSLMAWQDTSKLACFVKYGQPNPITIFKSSHKKVWFQCDRCAHEFESSPSNVTKAKRPRWCPFCGGRALCEDFGCAPCTARSLVAWSDKVKLACFVADDQPTPRAIAISSNSKFWFECNECTHVFDMAPNSITRVKDPSWCPYCARQRLCGKLGCVLCTTRSLAGWLSKDKLACFVAEDQPEPHTIAIGSSDKYRFNCSKCHHQFASSLASLTNAKKFRWCPYCAGNLLCADLECAQCRDRSLAAWVEPDKLACFVLNGQPEPRTIALRSNKKFLFKCAKCNHEFESAIYNITHPKHPTWCPYCAGNKLCGALDCASCKARSLAAWPNQAKLKCFVGKGQSDPHTIAISSNWKFRFKCGECDHEFESVLANVTKTNNPSWCPQCKGNVCGDSECKSCRPACDVCRHRGAIIKSNFMVVDDNYEHMCRSCFIASPHAPPNVRAKVSLEIYMLCELQRQARDDNKQAGEEDGSDGASDWIGEPTAWDCAVLPGLAYKPDMIWCFGKDDRLFQSASASKVNIGQITHAVILEILEVGIAQHSAARSVPDAVREQDIRKVFAPLPVAFLYVTVAAYNGCDAHPDDKFFAKQDPGSFEYNVVPSRKAVWQKRIGEVLAALVAMRGKNITQWIGH